MAAQNSFKIRYKVCDSAFSYWDEPADLNIYRGKAKALAAMKAFAEDELAFYNEPVLRQLDDSIVVEEKGKIHTIYELVKQRPLPN